MTTGFRSLTHLVWVRWALWLLFWTAVGFFFSTQTVLRSAPEEGVWFAAFRHTMPHWYVWGAMTPLIAWSDRWASRVHTSASVRIGLHGPFAVLWCSAVIFLTTVVNGALGQTIPPFSLSWLASQYHWNVLIYTVIVGVLVAYDYQRQATERAIHSSALEARLAQARLETLKAQLHPHFLFNTMNAISALTERDPKTARRMMAHLGDLLRYSLDHQDEQEITLAEELDLVQHYMAIQKVRFQDRLEFETAIDDETLSASVPSLVLQPLLENAVQHGVTKRNAPGKIRVLGKRAGDELCLEVADNGVGLSDDWGKSEWGMGLTNTTERLAKLYGTEARLDIRDNSSGGVTAEICVPWRLNGPRARDHR